jgi:hypothetical protein
VCIEPLIGLAPWKKRVKLGFDVLDSGLDGRSPLINPGKQRRRIGVAIIVRGCPRKMARNSQNPPQKGGNGDSQNA